MGFRRWWSNGWFPSSLIFALGLIVLGLLPAIQGPFPSYSLGTPRGTDLYVVSMILLAVGYYLADRREKKARQTEAIEQAKEWKQEREEIEARSEKRHQDDLAATAGLRVEMVALFQRESAKWLAASQSDRLLAQQGVPSTNPQRMELAETVRVSAATIEGIVRIPADSPFQLVTPPSESSSGAHRPPKSSS
jgi:hypothetical protein